MQLIARFSLLLGPALLFAIGCAGPDRRDSPKPTDPVAPAGSMPSSSPRANEASPELPEESIAAAPLGIILDPSAGEPIARWLLFYDRVASAASALVTEEPEELLSTLGTEWCYEDDDGWHAVFGRYGEEAGDFEPVLHYQVDGEFVARKSEAVIPAEKARAYPHAIQASAPLLEEQLGDLPLRMNTYVRPVEEGLDVWFLPAPLNDGRCLAGGEFCFHFDGEGKQFLGKDVIFTKFLAFTPGPESRIILTDAGRDQPSVGNLFFAYSHYSQFDSIKIETDVRQSLLAKYNDQFSWIHMEKSPVENRE